MYLLRSLASRYWRNQRPLRRYGVGMHASPAYCHHRVDVRRFSVDRGSGFGHVHRKSNYDILRRARWIIGSILTLFLPFWTNKWKSLLKLEGEVEMAVEVAETAAEMVEKVATVAEKVSAEVAEKLPKEGKLKDAALFIERVSKEAADEAHIASDIIHKVDELKQEVDVFIEPIAGHQNDANHQRK